MGKKEIVRALERMKVERGSLICLGCGYEDDCSIRGCAVIRAAADAIRSQIGEDEKMGLEEALSYTGEMIAETQRSIDYNRCSGAPAAIIDKGNRAMRYFRRVEALIQSAMRPARSQYRRSRPNTTGRKPDKSARKQGRK